MAYKNDKSWKVPPRQAELQNFVALLWEIRFGRCVLCFAEANSVQTLSTSLQLLSKEDFGSGPRRRTLCNGTYRILTS